MNIITQEEPAEQMVRKIAVRNEVLGLKLTAERINKEKIFAQIAKALPYMKIKKEESNAPRATEIQTLFFISFGSR